MKNTAICLLAVCILSCCAQKPTYVINGTVPDGMYDQEWVYLVPAQGPHPRQVDSVRVQDRHFTFTGTVEQVAYITTRPIIRLKLQELLLVTEPGQISVTLDSLSRCTGTPQNDSLQVWKELQDQFSQEFRDVLLQGGKITHDMVQEETNASYNFLKRQKANAMSVFVFEMLKASFSKSQLQDLAFLNTASSHEKK